MDRIKRTKELEAEDATAARKAVTAALWVSADGPNETETFLKALDEAGYVVARQGETSAWRRHDRIMDEEEKAEEAAATVARKAAAIPYSGSIKGTDGRWPLDLSGADCDPST